MKISKILIAKLILATVGMTFVGLALFNGYY